MARAGTALCVALAAVLLTIVFWQPLWTGGGFIGGDTYTYYFPQKAFYAECLARGELPLWNPLVSLGYPQLAESQTGALYPLNLFLYRCFDLNTAYSASHLLHAAAAYLFTWLFARRWGLGFLGAHLAALVFVYGWFPPRACLEWAIIGGAWFSCLLWCCESSLQTASPKWLLGYSLGLAMFLLAGHFNLAFIALLTSGSLWLGRLFWASSGVHPSLLRARGRALATVAGATLLGFAIAAGQLFPTAELKANSQRDDNYANQTYGHIPPWYLSEVFSPALWWGDDVNPDDALWTTHWGSPPAPPGNTNKIEAHLYFGIVPFYLMLTGAFVGAARGFRPARSALLWIALGLGAVAISTGWPIAWLRAVPGFGFFAGPGRYGIITTMAVGLGAAAVLEFILRRLRSRALKGFVALLVFGLTVPDLWLVSRQVTNVAMVMHPPVDFRAESALRRELLNLPFPARVWAPGENLPTLTGINCVREYLGIGPSAYYDVDLALPRTDDPATPEQRARCVDWLRREGVTHILRFSPLEPGWPVEPPLVMFDPFLNAAWARGREPLYLYRLRSPRPRAFVETLDGPAAMMVRHEGGNSVVMETDATSGGSLVLLELAYPGWQVRIDGQSSTASTFEDINRATTIPAGQHRVVWSYAPASFFYGVGVSAIAVLIWCGLAFVAFRRSRAVSS